MNTRYVRISLISPLISDMKNPIWYDPNIQYLEPWFQQYERRDKQYHVDRYLKSIQLDIPTFDDRLDYSDRSGLQNFWIGYKTWIGTSHDAYCLKLRKLALLLWSWLAQASQYWYALENLCEFTLLELRMT